MNNTYLSLGLMAAVAYLIRVTPFVLIRRSVRNQFIQSFLYYVPYVTLAVMTFPAIILATQSPYAGLAAFIIGVIAAYHGRNLMQVASLCVLTVLLLEWIII